MKSLRKEQYNDIFNIEDIDYLLNLPEVVNAKNKIDSKEKGSEYFYVDIPLDIQDRLKLVFGLDLTKVPMRWIKGDTPPHDDKSVEEFENTYLIYLTDSVGSLCLDGNIYPIHKNTGYVFSEGLSHETKDTGFEPRLLLGPMSEKGVSVGAATVITANGATDTIYFKYDSGTGVSYKINNGSYNGVSLPITIINTNISATLKVLFENDIVVESNIFYFICGSSNIQFGSQSLNIDGTRRKITIKNVSTPPNFYSGLIQNGDSGSPGNGYDNIYIYNLEVLSDNSLLDTFQGWIGQKYFGKGSSDNYIINCYSDGYIPDGGAGGIVGQYAGQNGNLTLIGCSSSGDISDDCGGLVGSYAGRLSGNVSCIRCWTTGPIFPNAGGIFGSYAGDSNGQATTNRCYSTGNISNNAGGIFGSFAGNATSTGASANNSYSRGTINGNGGGIFGQGAGSDTGNSSALNCYSSGTGSGTNGIYGTGKVNGSETNCYSAYGSWSTSTANTQLLSTPTPTNITIWVETVINQPYEINGLGYTPYTIDNIFTPAPILETFYSETINAGNTSIPAIRSGLSYQILAKKKGGSFGSYPTITINSTNGVISTTSETEIGIYTLYIRNTGSYFITEFELTVNTPSPSSSNIPPTLLKTFKIYKPDYIFGDLQFPIPDALAPYYKLQ